MAKVTFPESLPLGGILDQKKYRLLGTVTHKGGHNSGHYESFRRQVSSPPYSTPHSFGQEGAYSVSASPIPSVAHSPHIGTPSLGPTKDPEYSSPPLDPSTLPSPVSPLVKDNVSISSKSSRSSLSIRRKDRPPTSAPRESVDSIRSRTSTSTVSRPTVSSPSPNQPRSSTSKTTSIVDLKNLRPKSRKKTPHNRWWRISDEKIKECRTSEVLGMQREVYLLFYELDRQGNDD